MKKRKIFYFLKTKEEYDYMLSGGLIPRRGIVLIESTQEIYRDKKPYSGYGPLKTYFDSLRTDLQSLILDKTKDVSSMVDSINQKLEGDVSDYNQQFNTKLTKLQNQISQNAYSISDLLYYKDNTLIPSLNEIRTNAESLSNKYTEVLRQVGSNTSVVETFKSTLQELITNIQEFKSTYNNELTQIRESILDVTLSGIDSVLSESQIRSLIKEGQLSDTDFSSKVTTIVNPLLNSLKEEITKSVNAKISELSGGVGTGIGSAYQTATLYADELFNTHASKIQYGTVKIGSHLLIDVDGALTVNLTSLKNALALSTGDGQSSSLVTNNEILSIRSRLTTLESLINQDIIKARVKDAINALKGEMTLSITVQDMLEAEQFGTAVQRILKNLGILDPNGNYVTGGGGGDSTVPENTTHFQVIDNSKSAQNDPYACVRVTAGNNHPVNAEINNTQGLVISLRDLSNDKEIEKLTIGHPNSLGGFDITINEVGEDNSYTTHTGWSGTANGFTFKHGICVGGPNT